jgi:regulator of protease activity HflC (stomatin/prohibitin superfamily)
MSVNAPPGRVSRSRHWYDRHTLKIIFVVFLLFFGLTLLWPYCVVYIQSGHAGVYYSLLFGGTDTRHIRKEGIQFKLPWDTIFDYDIRIQQLTYRYSVISADGLTVQFNTSVRWKPRLEGLGLLQKEIGPDYAQKIVIPETQTALREVVGNTPIDQIYSTNVLILQRAVVRAVEDMSGKYIAVDNILITDVDIPAALRNAIEAKVTQFQNSLQYDYVLSVAKKEAERKRIEAEGIRDFQSIVTPGISENFLRWKGIEATLDLARSDNSKVVVIGAQNGLPLILDTGSTLPLPTGGLPFPSASPAAKASPSPYQEPEVPKAPSTTEVNPQNLAPVPVATPAINATPVINPTPVPTPQINPTPVSTPSPVPIVTPPR